MKELNKTENRKAMPKFLLIVLAAGLIGGIMGGIMAVAAGTSLPEAITDAIVDFLALSIPYAIWIITLLFFIPEIIFYKKALALTGTWDGEEETTIEKAESSLSWVLLLSALHFVLELFFFGISFLMNEPSSFSQIAILSGFMISVVLIVILQQKVIDLTKKINPEKKGSVYDFKFQEKWMNSCDENERRKIGQASYKAMNHVNITCMAVWLILVLLSYAFPISILPMFLVMLILTVSQITYCLECIRLEHHK